MLKRAVTEIALYAIECNFGKILLIFSEIVSRNIFWLKLSALAKPKIIIPSCLLGTDVISIA